MSENRRFKITLPPILPSEGPKAQVYAVEEVTSPEERTVPDSEPPSTEKVPARESEAPTRFTQRIRALSEENRDMEEQIRLLKKLGPIASEGRDVPNTFLETIKEKLEISQIKQVWLHMNPSASPESIQQSLHEDQRTTSEQIRMTLTDLQEAQQKQNGEAFAHIQDKLKIHRIRLRALSELAQELSS